MKTRKLDLIKEKEVMDKIQALQNRGEANFSNYDGDDDSYEEDMYEDEDDSYERMGSLNYEGGDDNYAPKKKPVSMKQKSAHGVLSAPQRTISINIANNIGVAGFSGKSVGTYPSATITLFGATQNSLPGIPALGVTKLTPALGARIDGYLYAGTANATDVDITVSSDTSTYGQIFSESKSSPYVVVGNKLFCTVQGQLINTYQTVEVDLLGRNLTVPYTPFDKQSAFQFSSVIIEDTEFQLKLDGNMSLQYTLFTPGASGAPSNTSNSVKISMYLYSIVEANRALSGKSTIVQSKTKRMPTSTQSFRMIK